MANFKFHVKSENHKDTFSVWINGVPHKYPDSDTINLSNNESCSIEYEDIHETKTYGYMNWDPYDPDDTDTTKRHHLNDINPLDFPGGYELKKITADFLSWKVKCKCKKKCKKDKYGGQDVTVTFGEDAP